VAPRQARNPLGVRWSAARFIEARLRGKGWVDAWQIIDEGTMGQDRGGCDYRIDTLIDGAKTIGVETKIIEAADSETDEDVILWRLPHGVTFQ
jgi:hypothetical protein